MFDVFEIWKFLKKIFSRKDILLIFGLIALYFAIRIINLKILPIFTDEGIYIRWAKVAWHDANWRFISLTDGRQPLQTWGTIPFLKLFPLDPLFAGRLFSVFTGFITLTGVFTFLFYLFNKRTAYIGALLYIFTPYFLFYDRIALADSAVTAGFIWILFLSILLVRLQRLDVAILFGFVTGLTLLSKSSARLFLLLSVFAPLLIVEKNVKKATRGIVNFFPLFAISGFIALAIYNIQRLSPFFHYVEQKNTTFVMTLPELIKNPFAAFFSNMKIIPLYILGEMGFVTGFLGLVGLYLIYKKDKKLAIYFLLWLMGSFFVLAFVSKVIFPRYLMFMALLLILPASYLLNHVNKKLQFILLVALVTIFIKYDYPILFDPTSIPFPPVDRGQYIEGVTAGWGVSEIIDFARQESQEKPVILLAEGNFGVIGDMLDALLTPADTRISIRGYWPLDEKSLYENQPALSENKVYIVFSHRQEFPPGWPMKFVKRYEKPGNQTAYHLFELTNLR